MLAKFVTFIHYKKKGRIKFCYIETLFLSRFSNLHLVSKCTYKYNPTSGVMVGVYAEAGTQVNQYYYFINISFILLSGLFTASNNQ
jgi:hypothetical protein